MSFSTLSLKSGTLVTRLKMHAQRILAILLVAILGALFTVGSVTVAHATVLAVGPVMSVTKTDTFVGGDGDGKADPGETIRYTTTISNSAAPGVGNDATGVTLTDIIDLHTTLVGGSLKVSPLAVNDAYTAIGNVSISQPAGSGLLANDFLGLNPAATVTAFDATSANSGTVAVNPDGSFTYDPPRGFTGTDTFTYTLSNSTGSNTGTVSMTVSGLLWFVDNNSACSSNCNGRLSHPYTTLAAFNTANGLGGALDPHNNDNIFVYESATAYSGGVTLRSGQKLIGQDATVSLATITGLTPPSGSAPFPTMNTGAPATTLLNAGGNGVTLNSGNTLQGFTAGNSSGSAISGSGFGTLTVADVIVNTTGQGLSLTNGTLSATFASVTSSGGANNIALAKGAGVLAGTLTINSGVLSGAAGNAFDLNGGTATISEAGTIASGSAHSVNVTGLTGGTVTFSGAITDTDTGITLTTNTGATINFTGGLVSSTGANPAFTATGGGTVNVCDENPCNPAATGALVNTLTTTTSVALNVANTTIGANDLEFKSISSNGGTSDGIILNTTGSSGGLKVVGDGTDTSVGGNSSGGTIQNKSGADGNSAQGIGIYLNNTSNVVLRRMTITGTNQNYGIRGNLVNGFTLEYSTVSGANGTNYNAAPNNAGEGSIYFGDTATNGILTLGTFTNDNISGGDWRNLSIINTANGASTTTLTFKGNTFGLNLNNGQGNQSLAVENRGTATINSVVGGTLAGEGNSFTGSPGDLVNFTGQTGSTMDVVFKNNTLSNNHPGNIIGGGGMTLATQGSMIFHVTGNSFRDANGSAITFQKASAGTLLSGFFDNNTIGVAGVTDSGSKTGNGLFFSYAGTGTSSVTITNNQIHQIAGNAHIYADNTDGSYVANFDIEHNTLDTPGAGWFAGIAVTNGAPTSTDTVNACAVIGGSTAAQKNTFNLGGGLGVIVGASGAASGHTFNLPTYAGGAVEANIETFLSNNNSGSFTTNAYVDAPVTYSAYTGTGTNCGTPIAMLPDSTHILAQAQPETSSVVHVEGASAAQTVSAASDIKRLPRQASWAKSYTTSASTALMTNNQNSGAFDLVSAVRPAPAQSGETVTVPAFTLPAGKSVIVQFDVTVDPLTLGVTRLLNQGTVSYDPSQTVLSTDPTPNADPACVGTSPKTCTAIDRPDTTVVSINRSSSNPTNASSVSWTVTFANAIDGLTGSNFTLGPTGLGGTPAITSVTAVGGAPATSWTVVASTGTGDGNLGLSMTSDTGLSHDVTNLILIGEVFTIDRTAPLVSSIVRQSPATNPTNADALVFRVTFNEPVTSVGANSFVDTGTTTPISSSVSAVTPNLVFDFTVDGIADGGNLSSLNGTVGLDIASTPTITDLAGNTLQVVEPTPAATNDQTYTVDNTAPTVANVTSTSANGTYTTGVVIPVTVTFSEPVIVTGTPQLTLETGATDEVVNYASGSGTATLTFNYTVQAGDTSADLDYVGTTSLALNGGTIRDAAANNATLTLAAPGAAGSLGFNKNIVIDTSSPTVTNVTSTAADGSYTTGAVIPVTVTFSEPVTVTGTPQLTLETGVTDQVVNYTSGSGTATLTFNYTVQAGDTSADLDYVAPTSLALNGGTIKDAGTNNASLTLAAPGASGSLGFNKALVIDTTVPTVTNVTSAVPNTTYGLGAVIPITVQFSEIVNVTGTPQLTLETGATDEVVNYTSGSGTNTLTFTYTTQLGDVSPDLDYVGTTSLTLNGGTIKDVATNNAVLTLPTPGNAGSLSFNKNIVINATNPVVTNVTSTAANGSYKAGAVIPVTVTFSSAVNVTGTPQLTLETGATDAVVNYTSGSGTATLTFNYTVGATDNSLDLDYVGTTSLALNGGTIQDASFNDAVLTLPAPGAAGSLGFNKDIVVDTIQPVVSNVTSTAADGSYTIGAVIPVTVQFSEIVVVTGTPQLTLETGATDEVVNYTSGSGTNTLTFNYTVQAGDTSADLDYKSTTALALNGGTITDAATNNATLTLASPGASGSLGFNKAIVIDTTAPTVTNVTSTAANGSYTTGVVIPVTVTFSKVVTVTGTPQLTLETGATDEVVNYASGSGANTLTFNYTVQAGDTSADLDYVSTTSLALNGGTIKDAATNNATLALAAPGAAGSLGFNKAIVIDTTAPTVTNVTSTAANATYGVGAVIPVTVTFSEAVTVTGTPQLTLETGATDEVANYTSGAGTNTLTFNYTVQLGDTSADLDYVGTTSLTLNGGTIQDATLNNAILTLASPGAPGSLGFNKAIVIDGVAPTVTNVTSTSANGAYGIGAVIPVTVSFSEAVTVTGTPQLTLETGATDAVVNYTSGSGTDTLTFNYTVQAGDASTDLDYVATTSLALNSGTIKDGTLNNAILTLATPGTANSLGFNKAIVIDAVAPDTFIDSNPALLTNNPSATFTFHGDDGTGVGGLTFECDLDGGGFSSCSSGINYPSVADGSHTFQVRAIDSLGNTDPSPASYTWTVDTTAPTVLSITTTATDPTNVSPIPVTITFSEPVCGFDSTTGVDLNVTNGTTSALTSGSNGSTVYTFDLTPSGQGLVSLYLMSGSVSDGDCVTPLNHNSTDSAVFSITYDTVAPTVVSSLRANPSPTSATNVDFNLTFSESVTGVDLSDFTLTASGITGATVTGVSGSGATRTVTINTGVGNGTLRLDVLDDGTIVDLASNPLGGAFTSGESYTVEKIWNVAVEIGGAVQATYDLSSGQATRQSFAGVNNGPTKIFSSGILPIVASERILYYANGEPTSFSEMMGLPSSQLDTTYWFPWYKNDGIVDTQLRLGNVSGSPATVHVYIAGTEVTGSPFTLTASGAGQSQRLSFALNDGPVKVVSDVPIVTTERLIYFDNGVPVSFSEMQGLPNSQLSTTYWFPWYKNVGEIDTQLRFGNVSGSTATVHVYIGGVEMTGSPFTLAASGAGQSLRVSFPVNDGPVKIVSDQDIVAAQRILYYANGLPTSFIETMGLPDGQLSTTHFFPWYKNDGIVDTQLRIGNVSGVPASVHVYIAGVEVAGSPFTLTATGAGQSQRLSFTSNDGSVKIVSDQNIVSSERLIYFDSGVPVSFSEMMGLPDSQLSNTYWMPWYKDVGEIETQLRFGVP